MFFSNYIPNKLITTEIKNKIKMRDIFYQQLKKWKLNLTVHTKSHTCEKGGHTSEFLFAFIDELEKQLIKKTVKVGQ